MNNDPHKKAKTVLKEDSKIWGPHKAWQLYGNNDTATLYIVTPNIRSLSLSLSDWFINNTN